MYVCVCRAVTDKQVKAAIRAGATTVDAVERACGAGGDCGGCQGMIDEMIEEHLDGPPAVCPGRLHLPLTPERAA
jgi:bacterioferritin-associated ferredoxin